MLPAELINTLKALALTQKPLPAALPDSKQGNGNPPFQQGQRLQGQVMAETSPGSFTVRIANQTVQMQLPASIHVGDAIELQVLSLQPRLTFGMVASANPLSTPEQLSSASRLLSALSQQQQQPEKAQVKALQSAPLWISSKAPNPQQLAGKLGAALANSGLFYESHQAQWLEGTRTTAQLMQEPQNQTPAAEQPPAAALASTTPQQTPLHIPQHLQPLVQQQLNALETGQIIWQGQVWPGQEMQWEIHEEQPRPGSLPDSLRQWVTQLHLDLPNLGVVTAKLRFNSAGLSMTLDADDAQTRAMLGNFSSQLTSSMANAGIPVTSALVVQHESEQ